MIANYTNHAANERTFLAWIRTVAAFGFFLIKLNVFVDAVGGGSIPPPSGARPRRFRGRDPICRTGNGCYWNCHHRPKQLRL
jgi:hypothetical protein